MSTSNMSHQYTFRVDEVEGVTRQSIISFLSRMSCRHVVAYEISDITKKPHYQGWVYSDLSIQTWQNKIKSEWPAVRGTKRGRSSGHYSCAPVRKDTYVGYCLKGTSTELPDIVSQQLAPFEELDVVAIHRQWWSKQASTPDRKVHVVEEGINVFRSHDWQCSSDDMFAKRAAVAEWIINKYEGKGLNSFLIKNYINGILSVIDRDYKTQFINQIACTERW